jgi:hypothetical protein
MHPTASSQERSALNAEMARANREATTAHQTRVDRQGGHRLGGALLRRAGSCRPAPPQRRALQRIVPNGFPPLDAPHRRIANVSHDRVHTPHQAFMDVTRRGLA